MMFMSSPVNFVKKERGQIATVYNQKKRNTVYNLKTILQPKGENIFLLDRRSGV